LHINIYRVPGGKEILTEREEREKRGKYVGVRKPASVTKNQKVRVRSVMLEKVHMTKANIGTVIPYWDYPSPVGSGWQIS